MDNASEEIHTVSKHEPAFGNEREAQRRKGQQSSPAPHSKAKTDGAKNQGNRGACSSEKGAESRADSYIVKARHAIFDILPSVKITSLKQDAGMVTDVTFDMLRQRRSPTRSRRKVVLKDKLLCWKRPYNWVVRLKMLIK